MAPKVANISERCSLVTFLVIRPTKMRTGLVGTTCASFSSLTRAFLFGDGDLVLDLRATMTAATIGAFSLLELLDSRLDERLEDLE